MCDYDEMSGKGRVRRKPGRPWAGYGVSRGGRGPKVTPSTWDAIIRAGPGGYMCYAMFRVGPKGYMSYPRGENRYPRALVRFLGRHGRVCLV